jgi:hypothetical protein
MLGQALPVVWGEFPTEPCYGCPDRGSCLNRYLDRALRNGYAGAWPWSWLESLEDNGCRARDGRPARPKGGKPRPAIARAQDLQAVIKGFAAANKSEINFAGGTPPS